MRRHELSQEDAARILAGSIRNMAAAPGTIFTPWHTCDLAIRDGQLCRVSGNHFDRVHAPIAILDELLAMSDEEIMRVVTGEHM